ncbi:hypothetical protein ABZ990_25660 [Streptomyces sp. NPDC046203]|uniref:hypothetical protein n=1 Tax=Streptomyces sp. NPDC046203 TaxID=3154602 RepID=UPI0033EC1791
METETEHMEPYEHEHGLTHAYGDGEHSYGRGLRRRLGAATVLAVVIAVTGCGQAPAASPSTTPTLTNPTTTDPAPTDPGPPWTGLPWIGPAPAPAPTDELVEVVASGGFAGITNRLTVRYDGSFTLTHGSGQPSPGTMTPEDTAALRAALESPAYACVPEQPYGRPVADGFTYEITYKHRVVVTRDGAPRPPALQRVLDALPGGGPPTGP